MLDVALLCGIVLLSFAAGYGLRAFISHRRRLRWLENHHYPG